MCLVTRAQVRCQHLPISIHTWHYPNQPKVLGLACACEERRHCATRCPASARDLDAEGLELLHRALLLFQGLLQLVSGMFLLGFEASELLLKRPDLCCALQLAGLLPSMHGNVDRNVHFSHRSRGWPVSIYLSRAASNASKKHTVARAPGSLDACC